MSLQQTENIADTLYMSGLRGLMGVSLPVNWLIQLKNTFILEKTKKITPQVFLDIGLANNTQNETLIGMGMILKEIKDKWHLRFDIPIKYPNTLTNPPKFQIYFSIKTEK